MTLAVAPVREHWTCTPDAVTCPSEHPLLFHRADFAQASRLDGHVWHACKRCTPTSFFFGVVRGRGDDPIVFFYRISRHVFDFWQNEGRELELADGSRELLYFLGHEPGYRPSKDAATAHAAVLSDLQRLGYFTLTARAR